VDAMVRHPVVVAARQSSQRRECCGRHAQRAAACGAYMHCVGSNVALALPYDVTSTAALRPAELRLAESLLMHGSLSYIMATCSCCCVRY